MVTIDVLKVDLSIPPREKPKPPGFPTKDPTEVLLPLYDAYASGCVANRHSDSRLSPISRSAESLPRKLLLIVPAIDILLQEQLSFVERLNREAKNDGTEDGELAKAMVFDKGFHGWLEGAYYRSDICCVREGLWLSYADTFKSLPLSLTTKTTVRKRSALLSTF